MHRYKRLHHQFRACLKEECPFVFAFKAYSSFCSLYNARYGQMPVPIYNDKPVTVLAVVAVGYDDTKECMIILNSWGEHWGDNGYFYMPYDFIKNVLISGRSVLSNTRRG